MSSSTGNGSSNREQENRRQRISDSSSLIVEPDIDSARDTERNMDAPQTPDRLQEDESLDSTSYEQSPNVSASERRKLCLIGLAFASSINPAQEQPQGSPPNSPTPSQQPAGLSTRSKIESMDELNSSDNTPEKISAPSPDTSDSASQSKPIAGTNKVHALNIDLDSD